jgi:general secretion pathway protein E
MSYPVYQQVSTETVCRALIEAGLINPVQAKTILRKQRSAHSTADGKTNSKPSSTDRQGAGDQNPYHLIDLITSLNLERSDASGCTLDEETICKTLADKWEIPYRKINPLKLDLNLVTTTIPRSFALNHHVLPIAIEDGTLTLATANPFNGEAFEDISRATNFKTKIVFSSKSDILKLINEFFGFKRSIAAAEHQFGGPAVDLGNLEQYVRLKSTDELPSNDQHIVNAVNHLLGYAFDQRASDIHIEPKRSQSLVRLRIDGVLHTVYELPKNVHLAVVSRIKAMARLNMAEKRRPQDGRVKTNKGEVEVEMRVSTIPVAFGEKMVIRIMDPDILFQDLEQLGFTETDLIRYNRFVNMPHGIILVCGPTGSGKSTTLYSSLRHLSSPEVNITTIEDPIEMVHESFNQIAVQSGIGITFGTILRNILRQDPDIIMIGEMRDLETASNAIQAALTGHLVLSTLHTNDAPSSITRLLDLGVPPFLIQATLVGVLSQRLVRKVCNGCKESFEIFSSELNAMGLKTGSDGSLKLYRGKGCQKCRGTGYFGRTGIFEVLPYVDSIKKITTSTADLEAIRMQGKKEGMIVLRQNAIKKMLEGTTTYQEVLRVTWEQP